MFTQKLKKRAKDLKQIRWSQGVITSHMACMNELWQAMNVPGSFHPNFEPDDMQRLAFDLKCQELGIYK